jgi:hypothetical protein
MGAIEESMKDKDVLVFLDYDGTLTPIVANPEQAFLGKDMLGVLRKLSDTYCVSIVTGRGMECITNFLGSELRTQVSVAASHGFDIHLRSGEKLQVADHFHAVIFDEFKKALWLRLRGFPAGCSIEETGYSATLHYRHAAPSDWDVIEKLFSDLIAEFPGLEKRGGKMVFEARLGFDWNKGKAMDWIVERSGKDINKCFVVYIGDDLTDEDAFRALHKYPNRLSVIVCGEDEPTRSTAAEYRMRDQNDVYKFLCKLIDLYLKPNTAAV